MSVLIGDKFDFDFNYGSSEGSVEYRPGDATYCTVGRVCCRVENSYWEVLVDGELRAKGRIGEAA